MSEGFIRTTPARKWEGDSNALIEKLTAIKSAPTSANKSEWQTLCRQLGEVLQGTDPATFFTSKKTTYVDKLIVALGGTA